MPHSAEEMTATLAGPPTEDPAAAFASWMNRSEMPDASRNAPKMMNTAMKFEQALMGVESMPVLI